MLVISLLLVTWVVYNFQLLLSFPLMNIFMQNDFSWGKKSIFLCLEFFLQGIPKVHLLSQRVCIFSDSQYKASCWFPQRWCCISTYYGYVFIPTGCHSPALNLLIKKIKSDHLIGLNIVIVASNYFCDC